MRRFMLFAMVFVAVGTACHDGGESQPSNPFVNTPTPTQTSSSTSPAPPPTSVAASPTPPALPAQPLPTVSPASDTCVNGWVTPKAGTPQFTDVLGIIRRTSPVEGDFVVVTMRYFVGPEAPPSQQGYLLDVRRWYVKLYVKQDISYQGRFLVEQREFGRGVAAVAPYDTKGFRAPDWSGFQWNSADPTRHRYPGLPGSWAGIRYDFVNGGAGLDFWGLPSQVVGCLDDS